MSGHCVDCGNVMCVCDQLKNEPDISNCVLVDKDTLEQNRLWLEIAMKDLVTLATLANNVIVKGSFPGAISDEVNEVLIMCKHINENLTKKDENE